MIKCPKCGINDAFIHPTYGAMKCHECQTKETAELASLSGSAKINHVNKVHRIQKQQDQHAKDIIQPWIGDKPNPDFAKAYPEQVEKYYTKEQLEGL